MLQNFSGSTRLLRKSSLKSWLTTNRTPCQQYSVYPLFSLQTWRQVLSVAAGAICLIFQRNLKYSQNFNQEGCIPASHSTSCINGSWYPSILDIFCAVRKELNMIKESCVITCFMQMLARLPGIMIMQSSKVLDVSTGQGGVSSKHYEMPANTGMLIEVPGQ